MKNKGQLSIEKKPDKMRKNALLQFVRNMFFLVIKKRFLFWEICFSDELGGFYLDKYNKFLPGLGQVIVSFKQEQNIFFV